MITLNTPYNGYTTGELTGGYIAYQYEVKLPNGKLIWLYEDAFTRG